MSPPLLAVGVLVVAAPFILARWQTGVVIFFAWIALEDYVRKFLGNSLWIYGVKDGMLLILYWSCLARRTPRERLRLPVQFPLVLWIVWVIAECFNPQIDTPLVAVVGVRMWLMYLPLSLVGSYLATKPQDVFRLFAVIISIASVAAVAGLIQAKFGLGWFNPAEEPELLRFGTERVIPGLPEFLLRPNSLFVAPGRFTQFLYTAMLLLFGLMASRLDRLWGRGIPAWWTWGCLALLSAGLFISGHRITLMLSLGALAGWHWVRSRAVRLTFSVGKRQVSLPVVRVLAVAIAMVGLTRVVAPQAFRQASALYTRTLLPAAEHYDIPTRTGKARMEIWRAMKASLLFGHGTGTASLGLQYIPTRRHQANYGVQIEGGYASVIWEWGLIGALLWLTWSLGMIGWVLRTLRQLAHSPYLGLGTALGLYVSSLLVPWFYLHPNAFQDYIVAAHLWLSIGILSRLPSLAHKTPP